MLSSYAKLVSALAAIVIPFAAGAYVTAVKGGLAELIIVALLGVVLGLGALAVFASLDTDETVAHLRRLNPGLKTGEEV